MIKYLRIEGMPIDQVNKNGRLYSRALLTKTIAVFKEKLIDKGRAVGELNPDYSPDNLYQNNYEPFQINLDKASHKILDITEEDGGFVAKVKILDTYAGKALKAIFEVEPTFGISMKPRGVGSLRKNKDGNFEVQDDYRLIAFDIHPAEENKMEEVKEVKEEKFVFFWGGIFSQWTFSDFTIDGVEYNSCEQYMMAKKALMFNDKAIHDKIMVTDYPKEQKALGRKVKNFDADKWNAECKQIVYDANYAKFTQNKGMLEFLMDTEGATLVEASPYDKIWGIGLAASDPRVNSRDTWLGTNWLGEAITKVRDDLCLEEKKLNE
jgi:hypothetical protein